MKIAIPTNDKINIVYHLRFAHGFMIFEIEDGNIQNKHYRKFSETNFKGAENSESRYAQFAKILSDCDLIILYALNAEIEREFKKVNIDLFLTSAPDLHSSIKLFKQGRLLKLK